MFVEAQLRAKGWTSLYHNVRVVGVQVDLILRDPRGLVVVIEVKTQNHGRLAHLPFRQRLRLQRVCVFLAQWDLVDLQLALVEGDRLRLLPVDDL